jgi:hypothetical protein
MSDQADVKTGGENEPETVYLLYMGVRISGGGNVAVTKSYHYARVSPEWADNGEMIDTPVHNPWGFGNTLEKGLRPGAVIKCLAIFKPGGNVSILGKGREYVGKWKDQKEIARLQMEHDGAELAYKLRNEAKANEWAELLLPIRQAYKSSKSFATREAILAKVIRYIVSKSGD